MSIAIPSVAVALAAYNGTAYIAEQVESILRQTGVDVTIFVSVDQSSDGTEAWFQHLAQDEPRVILLDIGQVFGGAAPNFFRLLREMDLDRFDYLSFADQDDLWPDDKLIHAHQQMVIHGADGYSSNFIAFWPTGKKLLVNKAQPQRRWDYLFESAGPGCTYVMCRKLALALQNAARNQREDLVNLVFHDWFAYAFARANGYRWLIDDRPSLLYRQHGKNQFGVNAGAGPFLRRVRQVISGEALAQAALIAQATSLPRGHRVKVAMEDGRWGLLRLAFMARHCRRKRSEQVYFFFSCMLSAICMPSRRGR